MSDTMLMFKPDCVDPDPPYREASRRDPQHTGGFPEILREAMRSGELSAPGEGWAMDFGAKVCLTRNMAEKLYAEHAGKPFYERFVGFASSGPSFVSVWSSNGTRAWALGLGVVEHIRLTYGRSDPEVTGPANIVHGSDSPESAIREVQWALRCMVLQCASFREEE